MCEYDAGFLLAEPMDEYQGKSGKYLSSHRLADFRKCPLLFHKKEIGLIVDEDRPAYQVGRAAHTLILEGRDVFQKEYATGGPINPKTGKPFGARTKAYEEWADAQGMPVITEEQLQLIVSLEDSVRDHKHAIELLSCGMPEGVIRAEYFGVPAQSRLDWFNPERGIVDLKTCDNLDWLQMDARSYGYAHQMAFYRAMVFLVAGVVVPVWMIAVEKREPYRCGVWRMGADVLGIAQRENEEAISRLKKCRKAGVWETGYEAIREFDWI